VDSVLVESGGQGRTSDYAPVRLGFPTAEGMIVPVRLTRIEDGVLVGEATETRRA